MCYQQFSVYEYAGDKIYGMSNRVEWFLEKSLEIVLNFEKVIENIFNLI